MVLAQSQAQIHDKFVPRTGAPWISGCAVSPVAVWVGGLMFCCGALGLQLRCLFCAAAWLRWGLSCCCAAACQRLCEVRDGSHSGVASHGKNPEDKGGDSYANLIWWFHHRVGIVSGHSCARLQKLSCGAVAVQYNVLP